MHSGIDSPGPSVADGAVPPLDELEDRHAGLSLVAKRLLVEQLALRVQLSHQTVFQELARVGW